MDLKFAPKPDKRGSTKVLKELGEDILGLVLSTLRIVVEKNKVNGENVTQPSLNSIFI